MDEKLMNSLEESNKPRKTFGKRSERRARMLEEDIVVEENKKTEEVSKKEPFIPAKPEIVEDQFKEVDSQEIIEPDLIDEEDEEPVQIQKKPEPVNLVQHSQPVQFLDEDKVRKLGFEEAIQMTSPAAIEEVPVVPITMFEDEEEEKPHTLFDREDSFTGIKKENPIHPVVEETDFQQEVISVPEEIEEIKEEKPAEEIEYVYKEGFDFREEDLFYEKKGFLMTQYDRIEEYLEQKSLEGYHFVRKVGKKYFFIQDNKEHYYYSINYFSKEPNEEQWSEWEKLGWEVVSNSPSKNKKEAGWFYFRHKDVENEYKKKIENEEEKYDFFRRYANSARSTLFLICICMIICIVAAYLQWQMQAMLISLLICGLIFVVAFVLFFIYLRMLLTNRSIAKKLRVQLRLKARQKSFHGEDYETETDAQLDTDWNELEDGKKKK